MARWLTGVWRRSSWGRVLCCAAGLMLIGARGAMAQQIWYVDDSAVGDPLADGSAAHPYATIQKGCDRAAAGDTVLVLPGMYKGTGNRNIMFFGKPLIVKSRDGAATCTIDVQSQGRGFDLSNYEPGGTRIEGLTIRGSSGGGIYIIVASCEVVGCHLTANNAPGLVIDVESSVAVRDCLVDGNSSVNDGGGIRINQLSFVLIAGCTVRGNTATRDGGGISGSDSYVYVFNSLISDNIAGGTVFGGGGVIFYRCDGTLTNSLVAGNRTNARDGGGVMINDLTNVLVSGATVVQNRAARTGGGVYGASDMGSLIANSIVWSNTPQSIAQGAGAVPVRYCDVQGGAAGVGNLNVDPAFVDPSGPDGSPATWADNDYHLAAGSACLDAGDNSAIAPDRADLDGDGDDGEPVPVDLDGEPRRADGGGVGTGLGEAPLVDMGAYEAAGGCVADLNGDGVLDFGDYLEFLNLFDAADPRVDFSGDGVVDFGDYLEFLNLYDAGCA